MNHIFEGKVEIKLETEDHEYVNDIFKSFLCEEMETDNGDEENFPVFQNSCPFNW